MAVVFRRGPSRQVRLIKWNLADDTFEPGQWFKGRIYERRCDLSPDGKLLIYFAATCKEPLFSWTAISQPPWLTAVALWPKGDGWNGGGRFLGPRKIHLNHAEGKDQPHPDFRVGCAKFSIGSWATWRGEDATVWYDVMERDGWECIHQGEWREFGKVKGFAWKAKTPEQWQKPHPAGRPLSLEMSIEAVGQDDGPWYVTAYRVAETDGPDVLTLSRADWADWDRQGDLLYARDGCLYRQSFSGTKPLPAQQVADFSDQRFEAIKSPDWARQL